MQGTPNATHSKRLWLKMMNTREVVEGQAPMGNKERSCVADDDSCTLFTQDTPLFGLGTPVPALFATEEAEHA